ncbi:MAG: hypothetical protein PHU03_01600 [Syntrophales bacterium]|nr:hypothetical protein [Syntrophales bacterium]
MKEETVFFNGGKVKLEGLYGRGTGRLGAVITHPHSQMGGSMSNNVVAAMVSAFRERGFSTLRFNFRGVGRSEGLFDNGEGERDDVIGALSFLAGEGIENPVLAGYSFGAWVNSKIADRRELFSYFIMVSPPLDFLDFDLGNLEDKCGLIICGDSDQFCPLGKLKEFAERSGCPLRIVRGTDHFYFGAESAIVKHLGDYLEG